MLDVRLFRVREFNVGSLTITLQYFACYGFFFVSIQYFQIAHRLLTAHGRGAGAAGRHLQHDRRTAQRPLRRSLRASRRRGHRPAVLGDGLPLARLGHPDHGGDRDPRGLWRSSVPGSGRRRHASTTLIMTSVPRAKSGVGSAVNDLSREFGGALGIAVLGSLAASQYTSSLHDSLPLLPSRRPRDSRHLARRRAAGRREAPRRHRRTPSPSSRRRRSPTACTSPPPSGLVLSLVAARDHLSVPSPDDRDARAAALADRRDRERRRADPRGRRIPVFDDEPASRSETQPMRSST